MASIVKRKNKYSVVYTYQDEKGEKRQKWETFATNAEAKKRKAEVEFQQESGTLVIPEAKTVRELLEDYTSIYGVNTWAMSTYEARRSLIFNYINPIIGDMKLSDLNTRVMEKYYQNLLKVKSRVQFIFHSCSTRFIKMQYHLFHIHICFSAQKTSMSIVELLQQKVWNPS